MKLKKSFMWLGMLIVLVVVGVGIRITIVGIPPRDQSASVLLATQKAVVGQATDVNKLSTSDTTGTGPVGIAVIDLCPNMDGVQAFVPAGYEIAFGQCLLIDACPNIPGDQHGWVPVGYSLINGQCVKQNVPILTAVVVPDKCSNIAGIQDSIPSGYSLLNGQCVLANVCPSSGTTYLIGGHDRHAGFADAWTFISSPLKWTSITTPTPFGDKSHHASVVFSNKLWVLGGVHTNTGGYVPSKDVWSFDGAAWHQGAVAPWTPRYDQSAVVFQNKLWMMGGSDSMNGDPVLSDPFIDTWTFNGTNWTQWDNNVTTSAIDPAPWAMNTGIFPFAANFPGYNFSSRNGRTRFKVAVLGNKLYLMGGTQVYEGVKPGVFGAARTEVDRNDVWSFDGTVWHQEANAPWAVRGDFILVPFQNKLWMMGGERIGSSNIYKDVWSFNGTTWHQEANAPWSARAQYAGIVSSGKLYITGGDPNSNPMLNDVWSFDGTTWAKVDNDSVATGVQDAPWAVRDGMSWVACP